MCQLVSGRTRCTIHVYACRVPPQPPSDHAPPDKSQVISGHLGLLDLPRFWASRSDAAFCGTRRPVCMGV
jgi:hypothetical protein